MAEQYSIAEARRNLPRLVHEAEAGKAVELTRRGEAVAIIVGRHHFQQLTSGKPGFAESYGKFAEKYDLKEIGFDPDELFSGMRADTTGREVNL
ncbi:MAG: type II toxin-antitoxin system prevent-host-death family antitoxin [Gammaproteobacteria bacterium]|nr:type II toxin-antitoxin system prevent-host-death family antitoxin [Gammaproteobacteria bacterium]MDE0286038.1 type II toxin-antitoxin system prevent-host-death family antitoxin [Gammaproteobacteria bacterium]MDE0514627.1 type II toxin-antitoxin system prevent-host-death family antitoxin [Gammaproteobacteria bacterium]